jgi:hypothetical protein
MIKKLTALITTFLLVVSLNASAVFAQAEAPTPPMPPTAPSTPTQPEMPSVPNVPSSTTQPQPSNQLTPSNTPVPTVSDQPKTEKTPHPKAATPKPAATAQAASTPKPAQTPVPATNTVNDEDNATASSAPLMAPQYAQSTGSQVQNGQRGQNTIQTGDANVSVNAHNQVNQNLITNPQNGSGTESIAGSVSNQSNGDSSNNSSAANTTNSSDMQLGNTADLNNNIVVGAYTGGNSASRNIGDNTILTGDANVGVTVINGGNNNVAGLVVNQYDVNNNQSGDIVLGQSATTASCGTHNVCTSGVLGSTANEGNGTDSTNSAANNSNNNTNTSVQNEAEVVNNVAVDAVTGKNRADSNVGNTNIETGDVNVAVTILNFLNNNILAGIVDVVNIFGNYNGDIVIPDEQQNTTVANNNNAAGNYVSNKQNGDSSTNSASQSNSLEKNVGQANVTNIDNNININANTGENRAASNTQGDNNVQTGDITAHAQVYNLANINSTEGGYVILINDKGTWRGKIVGAAGSQDINFIIQPDGTVVATNQDNGTDSTNQSHTNTTTTENVNQSNNATLQNNININADTGNNSASRNTGGNSTVSTGDVNVGASIMNFVNNNFIGRTFRVLLVNVFGEWGGRVRGSNKPANIQNQAPAVGGITATPTTAPSPTPKDTTQATASVTNLSPAGADNYPTDSSPNSTTRGSQVLGSMTENPSGSGFLLVLDDGRTYFSDDNIQTPQQLPLVAADIQANSKSSFSFIWLLLALPLLAGSVFGFRKVRGLIA